MTPRLRAYVASVAITATACATNPATGKRQISLVGEGQEISMGREAAAEVGNSLGLYSDAELRTYVNGIGQRLAATSERAQLQWSFDVVDDPSVNAFALPGGFIYVTRGLLAHLNSEAELAAVIGHEIGHVTARHSVNQISKAQLLNVGLGVGMILKPQLRPFGQIGEAGMGLLLLKYGRDDENEADELGLRYMTKAGYPAAAMPHVLQMLQRVGETEGGGRVPNWLSTHPNPQNRVTRVSGKLGEYGGAEGATVRREAYLRQIDGVVFGPDPREGFFLENTFYHPDMAFRMQFPKGFEFANQKAAVGAFSPNRDGVVVVTTAGRASAQAASREFFAQPGIEIGREWRGNINGLPTEANEFAAAAGEVPVRGIAAFVEHQGRVFQILGYSAAPVWSKYDGPFADAIESFSRLTDRRYLSIEPMRLKIVPQSRMTSFDELARRAPVSARTLTLINGGGAPDDAPRGGAFVKTVVGDELTAEIMREQERQREQSRSSR
jgi:predicted Zn-dependent protease